MCVGAPSGCFVFSLFVLHSTCTVSVTSFKASSAGDGLAKRMGFGRQKLAWEGTGRKTSRLLSFSSFYEVGYEGACDRGYQERTFVKRLLLVDAKRCVGMPSSHLRMLKGVMKRFNAALQQVRSCKLGRGKEHMQ